MVRKMEVQGSLDTVQGTHSWQGCLLCAYIFLLGHPLESRSVAEAWVVKQFWLGLSFPTGTIYFPPKPGLFKDLVLLGSFPGSAQCLLVESQAPQQHSLGLIPWSPTMGFVKAWTLRVDLFSKALSGDSN